MKVRTKNTLLFLVISLIPLIGMGKFAYENGKIGRASCRERV